MSPNSPSPLSSLSSSEARPALSGTSPMIRHPLLLEAKHPPLRSIQAFNWLGGLASAQSYRPFGGPKAMVAPNQCSEPSASSGLIRYKLLSLLEDHRKQPMPSEGCSRTPHRDTSLQPECARTAVGPALTRLWRSVIQCSSSMHRSSRCQLELPYSPLAANASQLSRRHKRTPTQRPSYCTITY
jgi:hypothetical protein